MSVDTYEIRQCLSCGLRYPLTADHPFGERCPSCLGETRIVLTRTITPHPTKERKGEIPITRAKGNLVALLDNVRSAWNVGSIFRTADGTGVSKLYLCGITPTPENEAVRKTSLGAEEMLPWEYSRNALETAKKLKLEGHTLIALEQDERAKPIKVFDDLSFQKIALIVGNEIIGIDPELLDLSNYILHIPMSGKKRSFNVEVAFGIAAFQLTRG